ncbi:MAG: imidazole glycerol phosphate synthase subunit HisF [Ruminococcus sp.]|jgi:cyclase|nr:imidazole glycerol phosphate synthase subunit HisF [Ruminococcus sp.]
MLAKRIIPCLDVRHGKVVKGVNFLDVKDVGDPVELAREYNRQGADELVFYDIVASHEGRGAILDVIRRTAENVFIPFCVGGGVSTVDDFRAILRAGADKVSVNSSAVKNPSLINEAADIFGCQCVVLGIDTKRSANTESGYTVCVNGGRIDTGRDLIAWAAEAERRGAGEICLNSMDTDGVRGGFDIPMLKAVCDTVKIPVIASGGAGKLTDFGDAFEKTGCSAALAASLFHFGELTIAEVKENCRLRGIGVR